MPLEPRQLLSLLEQQLLAEPPEGLEPAYIRAFLHRQRVRLLRLLEELQAWRSLRPYSRWGGQAGDALAIAQVSRGDRVVTPDGWHGVIDGIRLGQMGGQASPIFSVRLDSGRVSLVRQVFLELVRPVRVVPDVGWRGEWVAPDDFLVGLARCLEELVDAQAALRAEREAERRARLEVRVSVLRAELRERADVWSLEERQVGLEGARMLEALVKLELDAQWAGSQGLDWLRTPNGAADWREIPSGIMVVRPALDGERGLTMGWTRINAVREGTLGSLEAVFGPRDAVPLWSVRRVRGR